MIFRPKSLWKANLLFFGCMIVIFMIYFYWQLYDAKKKFQTHTVEDIQMLARIIQVNAGNAVLSQDVIEDILDIFLQNTAQFIRYLDKVEPLASSELSHLAQENGLLGIRICRNGPADFTEGPEGWLKGITLPAWEHTANPLIRIEDRHMFVAAFPLHENASQSVILGMSSDRIDTLSKRIGLTGLLSSISDLPGICYASLVRSDSFQNPESGDITLFEWNHRKIAETRLSVNGQTIVLGLDADTMFAPVRHIQRESLFFIVFVISAWILLSWGLYRYQSCHFSKVRKLERQLADEREDAALGRASAVIAHEVRNPLNAMSMGLQRLNIEAFELTSDHRLLIESIQQSIERTNSIVSDLQRYASPIIPETGPVCLNEMIQDIVRLYRKPLDDQEIVIDLPQYKTTRCEADRKLLEQAFENMFKNAIEAQPGGGFIDIQLSETPLDLVLSMTNGGFYWPESKKDDILSPYVTTKPNGSGLGLSIARRIIHAHGGQFTLSVPQSGCLCLTLTLPLESRDVKEPHENTYH